MADDQAELELKREFAERLLHRPQEPWRVALEMFRHDPGKGVTAGEVWPRDPIVLNHCAELLQARGPKAFVASKEDAARLAYSIAENAEEGSNTRLAATRLFAEIMGYIQRGGTNVQVNTTNVSKSGVLVVREQPGTPEEREQRSIERQRRLVAQAFESARTEAVDV